MSMFDEIVKTEFKPDGSVEVELVEDAFAAEELEQACDALVKAEKRLQQVASQPEVARDSKLNALWWNLMEQAYLADRALWELFTGKDRSVRSNQMYNEFRKLLLEGKSLRANA